MRMRTRHKGVAAVELALIAPILCLAILGTMEIGRAIQVQAALTNAVREGCRGFSDSTATLASGYQVGSAAYAQYLVTDSLTSANIGITTSRVTVTATATAVTVSGIAMTQATVTATLPYSSVSYFPAFIMTGNLSATVTMKKS
jgi:Flp pilus assembly protein TadG